MNKTITNLEKLTFRPYQPGDEFHILDLFQLSFGKPMSEEYWRWRFESNPLNDILIELAWDGDTLAGHYAVSPVKLVVNEKEHLTALSMSTMTHPKYRGLSLFPFLAKSLYNHMKDLGYFMVWGFPNNLSHRGFVQNIGWKDIYEIPAFGADLDKIKLPRKVPENVINLYAFDDRFDVFFQKYIKDKKNTIIVKKNSEFLNWRFNENPDNSYYILGYIESGVLMGYAVYKKYHNNFDIVDLLIAPDQNIGLDLVTAIISIAREKDIRHINMWLPLNHKLHRELERIGFINESPITYWGGCLLYNRDTSRAPLDYRNWYYTMADSDIY